MNNLDWNAIIQLVVLVGSIIFFMGKLDSTTKANHKFYESCIDNLHEILNGKFNGLENTMNEKFNGVSERFHSIKHDISRLEHKQEESNRIKERLAVAEQKLSDLALAYNSIYVKRQSDVNNIRED